jgi:site-specific recombinase XerD
MSTQKRQRASLPDHHVEALIDSFNLKTPSGLRDCTMVEVMFRAGLRISEVIALQLGDVRDLATRERRLIVRHGKGDKYREVPFGPTLGRSLERWLEARGSGVDLGTLLFPNFRKGNRGAPVAQQNFRATLKAKAEKAGLDPALVFPHALRHTYGTSLYAVGVGRAEIAALMGHSSEATTYTYLHPTPRQLADAVLRNDAIEEVR